MSAAAGSSLTGKTYLNTPRTASADAVSYVPQDPQMLHRSIAENIWYGQTGPIDLERVREWLSPPTFRSS